MSLNWTDLQCLNAFERSGTLQEAGQRLGVNHTTVARRIRQLEEALRCKLVETVNGRLTLTTAGRRAAEASTRMSGEALALERELTGQDTRISGLIRVGLLDYFIDAHAADLVAFQAAWPGVRLELNSAGSHLHNLARREADVVLRVAQSPRETLVGRRLRTLDYAAFVHESLRDRAPEERPWVGWVPNVGARMTDAWMEAHLRPEQVVFRVDTASSMFRLVKAGAGAALLPIFYAAALPGMVQLSEPIEGFETSLWILTHRDLAQLERIRLLIRFLADRLSERG